MPLIISNCYLDHVWGAIDFTTTKEANFPDWRNICTINAANTTVLLIPRENDKTRLYIELGLENGLIDTATGRIATQNVDSKRLIEANTHNLAPYRKILTCVTHLDCEGGLKAICFASRDCRLVDLLRWSVVLQSLSLMKSEASCCSGTARSIPLCCQ